MLHRIESITDVRFYDNLGVELLHVPDPQFNGKQLVFPKNDLVHKATYMMLTFDDNTEERVNIEPDKD